MKALGVDLAWSDATTANETGVVAAEPDGTIVAAGWTTGVDETVTWANTHSIDAAMLFVDAPLVVLNADKQRLCEKQVGQHYGRIESNDGEAVETMELVVERVHESHRLMFELLAATGLRRSELLVLEGRHLALDGERPHVKVRQRVRRRRGEGLVIGSLKSRYSKRDVPIPRELADRLSARGAVQGELVFPSAAGSVLDPDNLATRVLAPACKAAGVEWAGFHTFRHTVASRLFAEGRNVVQVQRWLGHHSASFTLDTYVHLLDNDLGEPLQAAVLLPTPAS